MSLFRQCEAVRPSRVRPPRRCRAASSMSEEHCPESCRLIVDPLPASGRWNMAVDEALLETAVGGGPCTVRWYRWDQATLSLGYFQAPEEATRDPRLEAC